MYDVFEQYLEQYLKSVNTADREIVITRTLRAPRELVFDAFTDPQHVGIWWGPNGFAVKTAAMDVRPGGSWRFEMTGPDGTVWPNLIEYVEVERPARLVYRHGSGSDADPAFDVIVTFEDTGGTTLLTMRSVFASPEALAEVRRYGAEELGNQTIDKLAAYIANQLEEQA
ncbi:ATPase [Pseudoduganella flava]|nr:ATPase [Pseudoduganella flava]